MDMKILIPYASKHGATAEIAEKIGEVLCQAGLQVDVAPVERIHDLSAYRAVILGSALYLDKWQKGAESFLKENIKALSERPVWLFSSGPTGEGDPVALLKGQRLPAGLQPVTERIRPRDITVFHGYNNQDKLNFIEKFAIKNIAKKPMGDFRNWKMIVTWTTQIAGALKNAERE